MNQKFLKYLAGLIRSILGLSLIFAFGATFAQTPFVRAKGEGPKIETAKQKALEKNGGGGVRKKENEMLHKKTLHA